MATVERRVVALIADAAGVAPEEIGVGSELSSLGMGSLERLECVLNLEDAFKVELDEADLRRFRTVQDVIDAVRRVTDSQP